MFDVAQAEVFAHAPVEGRYDLILIAIDLEKRDAIYPISVKNKNKEADRL